MPNTLNENWRPIPGYEGMYSVSDTGRVRSEDRTIVSSTGQRYLARGKILNPTFDSHGYRRVGLSRSSKVDLLCVHYLVILTFVGERPPQADICHTDGDPLNNHLTNLRYGTRAENIADSKAHGTFSQGAAHPCAILSADDAIAIYNATGERAADIAARYGVTTLVVNQIWRGDTWKSVTGGASVIDARGARTYCRTILTKRQAEVALSNRANRVGRKDGRGIQPTADALGVDFAVVKSLYTAVDAGKTVIFAE